LPPPLEALRLAVEEATASATMFDFALAALAETLELRADAPSPSSRSPAARAGWPTPWSRPPDGALFGSRALHGRRTHRLAERPTLAAAAAAAR